MSFKTLRVTVLLLVLAYIALDTFLDNARATDWQRAIRMVVYPINADGSEQSARYIKQLKQSDFDTINAALVQQGKRHGKALDLPVRIDLAPELPSLPPAIPKERSGFGVMWWSIKLRYWAWKNDNYTGPKPQIKAYALYYSPKTTQRLAHSTGLHKAKLSINYLFGSKEYTQQNNVVILHEMLHTLGATDKYDLTTGYPHFPEGFGNSQQRPLYPQKQAEIMGAHIAISESKTRMPNSLKQTNIGEKTAQEIGWRD